MSENNPIEQRWLVFATAYDHNYWICAKEFSLEALPEHDHLFRARFTLPIILAEPNSFTLEGKGSTYYCVELVEMHYKDNQCFYDILVSRDRRPVYELGTDGPVAYVEED